MDQIKADFWLYTSGSVNHQNVSASPIFAQDSIAEGKRELRRVLWFRDLPTNINPTWDILCSASLNTIDALLDDSSSIFLKPMQPHNCPITLPMAGAGFLEDTPPKFKFATPDRLDIEVFAIDGEFVRCVAAIDEEFGAFKDLSVFWSLQNPAAIAGDYGTYAIGGFSPPLLTADMYAARTDTRVTLVISVYNLLMATRYTCECATSTIPAADTTVEESSLLMPANPTFFSTRGNSEAIHSIYPQFVVAKERTLLHLYTENIVGDNFYKLIAFTHEDKLCDDIANIISPFFLEYQQSTVYVVFTVENIGKMRICYSGDGGNTFWIQDSENAFVDVTATSRYTITAVIPSWSVIGEKTTFELHSNSISEEGRVVLGNGFSKKIALSLDGKCQTLIHDEYIQLNQNRVQFTLQEFMSYDICYSEDSGMHWTLQITDHLSITGYATHLGASNAQLKYLQFEGVSLDKPFHPLILKYQGLLSAVAVDIDINYETYEPLSTIVFLKDNVEFTLLSELESQKIVIHASHIQPTTMLVFVITAPDRIHTEKYEIAISRISEWNEDRIQSIAPNDILSDIKTIWTLYPVVNGDGLLTRLGFVFADNDCRLPELNIAIDEHSQAQGTLRWHFTGKGRFSLCYSVDGGRMWHKQISSQSVVTVDGSYLRTPYHIASLMCIIFFVFLQWYCAKLFRSARKQGYFAKRRKKPASDEDSTDEK